MDDVKITTGQGAGPEYQPKPFIPTVPPPPIQANAPLSTPGQPDFITSENLGPSPIPPGVERGSSTLFRRMVMVFFGIVFVVGVGSLGYFVVYPTFFPAQAPSDNLPLVTTPLVTLAPHTSYLTTPASAVVEVKLADVTYPTIASALQNESFNQLADGQYKEVRVFNNAGQVPFGSFLGGLSPAAKALALGSWFENDFTALLYYDAAGVWPLYIAKLKPGAAPEMVKAGFRGAENTLDLANFYINSPGSFTSFKDGKVDIYPTRYNSASGPGAAFNYGMLGNYLVISTNYSALKNLAPILLGF